MGAAKIQTAQPLWHRTGGLIENALEKGSESSEPRPAKP